MMRNRFFSVALIFLGLTGLMVSLLGEITPLGDYKNLPPQSWDRFDPQLVVATPDFNSLKKHAQLLLTEQQSNRATKDVASV